jgi:hypothetical protein
MYAQGRPGGYNKYPENPVWDIAYIGLFVFFGASSRSLHPNVFDVLFSARQKSFSASVERM